MLVHTGLSLVYGYLLPWGGDEWYTYNDQVFVGTPNNWLVQAFKYVLGPVSPDNFLYYRQVGLFWTIWVYPIVAYLLTRNNDNILIKQFFLFLIVFTFSPFIWLQEQMFRYYGLYLLYSFVVNVFIFFQNKNYEKHRWLFYFLAIISLPVHYLITWQLIFYILWKEFSIFSLKFKIAGILVGSIISVVILTNLDLIWNFIFVYGSEKGEIRGWGLNSIIKPVNSIFQYVAGYELLPTESILILIAFIMVGLTITRGIWLSLLISSNYRDYLFAGFIPFLATFLLLEPITMPGATNLESKHAMFFIFWMVFYFVIGIQVNRYVSLRYILFSPLLILFSTGIYYAYTIPKTNWNKISQLLIGTEIIFTDGPTTQSLAFYTANMNPKPQIVSIWDTIKVSQLLTKSKDISYVFSDYKQYQLLSINQMWNSGTSSKERYTQINYFFTSLNDGKFVAKDSYTNYPLIANRLIRHIERKEIPYFYEYPYADLHFPLVIGSDTILGMKYFQQGDSIYTDQSFYYMVETRENNIIDGISIIRNKHGNITDEPVRLLKEKNKYKSIFCRAIEGYNLAVYQWNKRPLLSSSLKYPGSMFYSKGIVYRFNPNPNDIAMVINRSDVKLYRFVPKF